MSIPVQIGNDNSTTYQLHPKGSLVLKNREINSVTAVKGNIAQCAPVTSPDEYSPGQFPFSAVDGAASTKWAPVSGNTTQSLTVDLTSQPYQRITSFFFDWAQNPPVNFTVSFSNATAGLGEGEGEVVVYKETNVTISEPYNATLVNLITAYMSNKTSVTLGGGDGKGEVWSGRYATLRVWGNQVDGLNNGTGATVAEWAILGSRGRVL